MKRTIDSLPDEFVGRMNQQLGGEANPFFESLGDTAPVSIRLNPLKPIELETTAQVPWCEHGGFLQERPVFTLDPLFHAGCYYVQEAGSMFLDYVLHQLKLPTKSTVVDLCAAPGGKSTLLASYFADGAIISNEVIKSRTHILVENCAKWGTGNFIVTQNDPLDFGKLGQLADVLLIDAPCSGEGLFRKDPKACDHWSSDNCELSSQRQRRIVRDSLDCLKGGGFLIYSTCTYNPEENDLNVERFMRDHDLESVEIGSPKNWNIESTKFGKQFYPHRTKGEGFYISILRKKGEVVTPGKKKKGQLNTGLQTLPGSIEVPVLPTDDKPIFLVDKTGFIFLVNNYLKDAINSIIQLNIWDISTKTGALKGNKFTPFHHAVLNPEIRFRNTPYIDLTKEEALRYLRRETIHKNDWEEGFNIVRFEGYNLGLIKKIQRRSNNYYPKEWRIRMEIDKEIS